MDTVDVIYIWNTIQGSHEKEGNPAICDNMDGSGRHYAQGNQSDSKRQILYAVAYMWNLRRSHTYQNRGQKSDCQELGCWGEEEEFGKRHKLPAMT